MSSCHPSRHLCATLLLLLCGCTPLEWQKTGVHDVDRDLAQCLAQARLEARQRMPLQPVPVPQVMVDQQGRTIVVQNQHPDSERFFLEQSLLRDCMTGRGYTLQAKPRPGQNEK